MYHEQTYDSLRQRRARRARVAVACALVALVAWRGYVASREISRDQAATALRESVMASALQCCAIEGSYPVSLQHLEQHYGLVVNARDYQVRYEWLGDNVPPSVVVRPL